MPIMLSVRAASCNETHYQRAEMPAKNDPLGQLQQWEICCNRLILENGRGERIRTSDPLVPNQVQSLSEFC